MCVKGLKIAVVGSGVSGLASAWLLHHHGAVVTVFEREDSCGGHTLTDTSTEWPVDLGFQVYNLTTYPHLSGWLEQLGVPTEPSDMSFALSVDGGKLEWGSHNLDTIFCQRKNMTDPSFLRMVWDVIRFGRQAPGILEGSNKEKYKDMSLDQYLKENKYSNGFKNNYVLPMCAAVWSVPASQVLSFPIQMMVRFWKNHHLLDITQRPCWRVVKGRSVKYITKVLEAVHDVRTSSNVQSVSRAAAGPSGGPGVTVSVNDKEHLFDRVILATHSDVSRTIRGLDITPEEASVLDAVPYNDNHIYFHSDKSLMPKDRKAWASWNFIGHTGPGNDTEDVCVSYWANLLQSLPETAPDLFVTLNPPTPPAADTIFRELSLAHPVFGSKSWDAQLRIPEIQGCGGIYYAGAWCGYGFHEDGMRSAVAVLASMGHSTPWHPRPTNPKTSLLESYYQARVESFLSKSVGTGHIGLLLPNGEERSFGCSRSEAPDLSYACVPGYPTLSQSRIGSSSTAAAGADLGFVPGASVLHAIEPRRTAVPLCASIRVLSADFFKHVVTGGDSGLAHAYMARDFEVDSLESLVAVLVANAKEMEKERSALGLVHWTGCKLLLGSHMSRPDTVDALVISIENFLDSPGTLFHQFLDAKLSFGPALHLPGQTSLENASEASLDAILEAADVNGSKQVLELGSGWGALAMRGLDTTAVMWATTTLSKNQLEYITKAAATAGVSDRFKSQFSDWRDFSRNLPSAPQFDSILCVDPATVSSIAGDHLAPFFLSTASMLNVKGTFTMLAITSNQSQSSLSPLGGSFIRENVFASMHLPSQTQLQAAAMAAGFEEVDTVGKELGGDFAATIRQWRTRLENSWLEARQTGLSDATLRKHEFAFALIEAAFEAGLLSCKLVSWRFRDGTVQKSAALMAKTDLDPDRMQRHYTLARPVQAGLVRWLQCFALLLVGWMINRLLFGAKV